MPQFLFVVDMPPMEENVTSSVHKNVSSQWQQFEYQSQSIKMTSSNSMQLSRNVWLLDAQNSLPTLLGLSALADTCKLQYVAYLVNEDMIALTTQISHGRSVPHAPSVSSWP